MKLVLASGNAFKLAEIRQLLPESFDLVSLKDLGFEGEIAETEATFEGNALLKARFISKKYGVNVIADDSGLEVEALNGKPGVYSARYSGDGATPAGNNARLLTEMAGKKNRRARFVAVLALILDGKEHLFRGEVTGIIAEDCLGTNGFGYDPLFIPDGYKHTFGELSSDIKQQISHRSKAMKQLQNFIAGTLPDKGAGT